MNSDLDEISTRNLLEEVSEDAVKTSREYAVYLRNFKKKYDFSDLKSNSDLFKAISFTSLSLNKIKMFYDIYFTSPKNVQLYAKESLQKVDRTLFTLGDFFAEHKKSNNDFYNNFCLALEVEDNFNYFFNGTI